MYVNTLNNTNKEQLVITVYHNKVLHTIHNSICSPNSQIQQLGTIN